MTRALHALLSRYLVDRTDHHRASVFHAYQSLVDMDFWTSEKRRHYVEQQINALLVESSQHIPRYRGISPKLENFPVLNRHTIQTQMENLVHPFSTLWKMDYTGGSSGTPMGFRVDRSTQVAREASQWWTNHLAGWRLGDRIAMLWGADRDTLETFRSKKIKIRWWMENTRWYNAFDMDEKRMMGFYRELSGFQPDILIGYAGALYSFALFLEQQNISLHYPLKAIVSSAEVLHPHMRETVERVFGKKIFDRYGNREFGAIAGECHAHHGFHVNEHDMLVEIVSPDPYHIPGPIQITYFPNRVMPWVRYQTGDLACWLPNTTPCPCGRLGRRLSRIVGREVDMIRTADGRQIHGEFFTHLLYGIPGVHEFQLIQQSETEYLLCLSGDQIQMEPHIEQIRKSIIQEVGPVSCTVKYVEKIPLLSSGKRKFVVSMCQPDPQESK